MSDCKCEHPYDNVTILCQSCANAQVEAVYSKWPGLRDFHPDPDLPGCCQRDEVADRFGWDAAWEWDHVRFLMGDE